MLAWEPQGAGTGEAWPRSAEHSSRVLCGSAAACFKAGAPAPAKHLGPLPVPASLHLPAKLSIALPLRPTLPCGAGTTALSGSATPSRPPTTPPSSGDAPAGASTPPLDGDATVRGVCGAAEEVPAPGGDATAAAPDSAAAAKAAVVVALWRRVQHFMRALLGSPVLLSALLALELEGSHPVVEESGAQGVDWTVAQMLALHLKSGRSTATETDLLALLWTLESWGNVWRGPCTAALQSYLRNLTEFDRQRAMAMSQDWPNQFRGMRRAMSESQVDLLKRLDWRLRLDLAREVGPCRDLLFRPPHSPSGPLPHAAAGAAPHGARSVREEWVARMEALCIEIRGHAAALERHPSSSHATESAEEEEEPITPAPPKRQRVQ